MFGGCDLHPGNVSESYFHVAFQGSLTLSFQGSSYKAAPDVSPKVDVVVQELNKDPGTSAVMQVLMNYTFPQLVRGLIEAGKSDLEKQGQPVFLNLTFIGSFLRTFPSRTSLLFGHGDREGSMRAC